MCNNISIEKEKDYHKYSSYAKICQIAKINQSIPVKKC